MKTILRELLGYEGVKGRPGHQAGPKTNREIFALVWEGITRNNVGTGEITR